MLVAQIFALIIFVAMFILIISEKIEKHYITLGCGLITLVVGIWPMNAQPQCHY